MKIPIVSLVAVVAALQAFTPQSARAATVPGAVKKEVIETYASIAAHCSADAQTKAEAMKKAVAEFTAAPSAESLDKAKQAWIEARLPYLQSEVFRYSAGAEAEIFVAASIDYLKAKPKSGIIHDAAKYPSVDKIFVGSLGGKSSGFAAIEFLLWGEDLDIEGPGKRPFEDYIKGKNAAAARRAQYVNACAELVAEQVAALAAAWKAGGTDNQHAKLLAMPADEALGKILTGIVGLSGKDLAVTRVGSAYASRKNESSGFSDTSHLDVMYNCSGIANVIAGAYVGSDKEVKVRGAGVLTLATALGEKQGNSLKLAINAVMLAVTEFRPPLDRALIAPDDSPAREAVKEIIDTLVDFAKKTSALGAELGVKVGAPKPKAK